jgi:dTDP-4-dehydrorhamnose reductase
VRVLVAGAAGQLGGAFVEAFGRQDEVVALTRQALDITDPEAVQEALVRAAPEVVVNCAAYNDVDGAEDDPVAALRVNALAVRGLARASAAQGATLVHFSTDFVFDGTAGRPYTEEDGPNPQSVYGTSKLLGEWFACDAPRWYVLRVESLYGGRRAKSSVDRIIDALVKDAEVRVFVDRTVSPSYVEDVVAATRRLLAGGAEPGLYHCVNTGMTTWLDLAVEAARILGRPGRLLPVRTAEVPLRARRPVYCALDNSRLRRAGVEMPLWQDALARYIRTRLNQEK